MNCFGNVDSFARILYFKYKNVGKKSTLKNLAKMATFLKILAKKDLGEIELGESDVHLWSENWFFNLFFCLFCDLFT